jgi:hypothetical protein
MALPLTFNEQIARAVFPIGETATFSLEFPYPIGDAIELDVYENGVKLVLDVDYGVTGAEAESGCTIVFDSPGKSNTTIGVIRRVRVDRQTLLPDAAINPNTLNFDFADVVRMIQDVRAQALLGIYPTPDSPLTEAGRLLPVAAERAGRWLKFDEAGTAIVCVDESGSSDPANPLPTPIMVTESFSISLGSNAAPVIVLHVDAQGVGIDLLGISDGAMPGQQLVLLNDPDGNSINVEASASIQVLAAGIAITFGTARTFTWSGTKWWT